MQILQRSEIEEITGRVKFSAQCRVLEAMRIPFLSRGNGSPVVAREAANQAMGVVSDKNDDEQVTIDIDAL